MDSGNVKGIAKYVCSFDARTPPLAFGLTNLANDPIWLPVFFLYLRDAASLHGGWLALLRGD